MQRYSKTSGKNAIMGVRQSESKTRRSKYTTCLKKNGDFSPIYDWTDEMVDLVYRVYNIEIPSCYEVIDRTGCAGCPYGRHGHPVEKELALLPRLQRNAAIRFFRESYDVLGVDYKQFEENQ
jgi:3'-phosphoadenosine 5'-phosphosulfate sulfotransferase (PAPS reductase)/FAD synthetase